MEYKLWCKTKSIKLPLGKKQFFKRLEDSFVLVKKQKADGKRYYVRK